MKSVTPNCFRFLTIMKVYIGVISVTLSMPIYLLLQVIDAGIRVIKTYPYAVVAEVNIMKNCIQLSPG